MARRLSPTIRGWRKAGADSTLAASALHSTRCLLRVSSDADCSPIGPRLVLSPACRGQSSIRRPDLAGFTRSSTTASGSWRTAGAGAFVCSLATAMTSVTASRSPPPRSRSCPSNPASSTARPSSATTAAWRCSISGHVTNAGAVLCAFDLLEVNGEDIRREPIEDRKRRLAGLLRLPHDGIAINEHFGGDGAVIYKHACALGCEGIVSKRLGSPYRAGRSAHWLKIKNPDAPAVRRLEEEDWT